MNTKIEKAIEILADKITAETKPDDALKYTQAALNLAHTKATNDMAEINNKQNR